MDTIQKNLGEDSGSHSATEFDDCSIAFVVCSYPLKLQDELNSFFLPSEKSSGQNVSNLHICDLLLFDAIEEAPSSWILAAVK